VLVTNKLSATLNHGDAETSEKPFWELNKFHFNDKQKHQKTGRGAIMLAVLSAWCLLARPDAPPMRVLRCSGNNAKAIYKAMGFVNTISTTVQQLDFV
jgi:hypothetical protein